MFKLENADFKLLHLTDKDVQHLGQVKTLDIYDQNSDNFHDDGLFSTTIFHRVGDPARDTTFGYIDTKIEVMHPLLFKNLLKIKRFYGDIIRGSAYAVFDNNIKDFVPSDELDGETGYNFFLSHWDKIVFQRNDSSKRTQYIELVEKYKPQALTNKIVVLPAGLRDLEPDPDGRDQEGEINEFYRKILSITNTLNTQTETNTYLTDNARLGIQNAFNSIFSYILSLLKGKTGFILKKWARRKVFNSTRTVLTGQSNIIKNLKDENYPKWNHTTIGIAQLLKALIPVGVNKVLTHPLVIESFPTNDSVCYLVSKETLTREEVRLENKELDKWTTQAGIESLFDNFMEHSVRSKPVEIGGHYLGLIYVDEKNGFKIVYDINDAENYTWMKKELLRPITWVEFFYLMGYKEWNTYPMTNTRYPISGAGSIFPAYTFCKTTVDSEVRYELEDDGTINKENKALSFPILKDATYVDSASVSSSRLGGLGADGHSTLLYSTELQYC